MKKKVKWEYDPIRKEFYQADGGQGCVLLVIVAVLFWGGIIVGLIKSCK